MLDSRMAHASLGVPCFMSLQTCTQALPLGLSPQVQDTAVKVFLGEGAEEQPLREVALGGY